MLMFEVRRFKIFLLTFMLICKKNSFLMLAVICNNEDPLLQTIQRHECDPD